jgi:hypothetical protein
MNTRTDPKCKPLLDRLPLLLASLPKLGWERVHVELT